LKVKHAISAYHHGCCEFESRSGRGAQHYVIKFVSDLRQPSGFLVFKFEPFVLHVQCLTIKHAQLMVSINSFKQFVLYIEKMKECVGKQS
jgi:hypothetical protein